MTKPPSSYLRRFHYDTITHSGPFLRYMIREIGADRILLGSDYPADMGYTRPVDVVMELNELTARERNMLLADNAARLLKL
jgi:aminocarboxymuconate-semialdehyde decarboxylase